MIEIKYQDYTVKYNDSDEIKQKVFDRVMAYFKEIQEFSGEGIMQTDNAIIEAPNVMADIADDILKFDVTWKDGK